jgi:hypothetical protein
VSTPPPLTSRPNPLKTLPQNPSQSLPINSAKRAQCSYEHNHRIHAKSKAGGTRIRPCYPGAQSKPKFLLPVFAPKTYIKTLESSPVGEGFGAKYRQNGAFWGISEHFWAIFGSFELLRSMTAKPDKPNAYDYSVLSFFTLTILIIFNTFI